MSAEWGSDELPRLPVPTVIFHHSASLSLPVSDCLAESRTADAGVCCQQGRIFLILFCNLYFPYHFG